MASERSERHRWQELGSAEPYWTVCTDERYRSGRMSPHDRADFFASGQREVGATLALIESVFGAGFRPDQSLDFGCGVGRLTLPIARVSRRAVGVDISEMMLAEARANATRQAVANVEFQSTDDALSQDVQDLDFVHSYIVFQHVDPRVGMDITRKLLARLKPGGIGALHYAFRRRASLVRRVSHLLRRHVPFVNAIVNISQGRSASLPMIPLHEYDESRLVALIAEFDCTIAHMARTDHAGLLGAMFFFRKASPT